MVILNYFKTYFILMQEIEKLNFLPNKIITALKNYNLEKIFEIRIRKNQPIILNYCGKYKKLLFLNSNVVISGQELNDIIALATEHSIYAYNEQIKKGFLTTKQGIRIGLAGDCVFEEGNIITIKNFSSINIRIPHYVKGASNKIFPFIINNGKVENTLIISPAGLGKTTILKDLISKIDRLGFQTLVIDERGELFVEEYLNVDYLKHCDKNFAFTLGLRSLSPRVVIFDEIIDKLDWLLAEKAIFSGVNIIGTIHANNLNDLLNKSYFKKNVFNRYVFIKNCNSPGQIQEILDGDFKIL